MSRLRVLQWAAFSTLALLASRLFWMQVVQAERYQRLAQERIQHERVLDPRRGRTFDRRGRPLVENAVTFDVLAVPAEVTPGALARLAELLGQPREDLEAELQVVRREALARVESDLARRFGKLSPARQAGARRQLERYFMRRAYLLVGDVPDLERAWDLFARPAELPGLAVRPRPVRRYPAKDSACHLVGWMGRVQAEELSRLRPEGYDPEDRVGRSGLERRHEAALRGQRGVLVLGRRLTGGQEEVLYREAPEDGTDLALTLDLELQGEVERALDARLAELFPSAAERPAPGAAAVVLDVRTGAVLALASSPRYDPSAIHGRYGELARDPRAPLAHRAISGARRLPPPGSVFKIVTALAALEEGAITQATAFSCAGYLHQPGRFRCWKSGGHGTLSLLEALEQSCNVYFYQVGERLGPDKLAEWGRRFGFGEATGIETWGESAGLLPDPAWKRERLGEPWTPGDTRYLAIGQGALEVTPLQVARAMAAVATRGALPAVRVLAATPAKSDPLVASPAAWDTVIEGLRQVVRGRHGTASRYGLEAFDLAAKTGTAEVGRDAATHAWLAGFAPAAAPEIALVVLIEHSGHGGEVAGPVAARILAAWKRLR